MKGAEVGFGERSFSCTLFFFNYIYTLYIYNIYIYLPAIQETPVGFLGQEDPLEKG